MDVLLMNDKDEVIAAYIPNRDDFKKGDVVSIYGRE